MPSSLLYNVRRPDGWAIAPYESLCPCVLLSYSKNIKYLCILCMMLYPFCLEHKFISLHKSGVDCPPSGWTDTRPHGPQAVRISHPDGLMSSVSSMSRLCHDCRMAAL